MQYVLTAATNVLFNYEKGDKNSSVKNVVSTLFMDGVIPERFMADNGELNKDGVNAMHRVLSQGIVSNIKYAESKGFSSKEDREKFVEDLKDFIISNLEGWDKKNSQKE